jgi:hypothetical protein
MIITMILSTFYSKNGTSTVSKWSANLIQNRADYQLTAKLDENNEISEQELLHTQITVLINGFCLDEFRSKFI